MQSVVESGSAIIKPLFKKSRMKKWIYGGAAVVIVLGAGIPLTLHKLHAGAALPSSYIYTVRNGSITQTISTSGTIQPAASLNLNFQGQAGLLKHLDVKIGDTVKAGQPLAEVDNTTAKVQVAQAESGVTQANANLATAQMKLTQTQAGTPSAQIFGDQQAVKKAQLSVDQAQQAYQGQVDAFNNPTSEEQQLQSAQNAYQQAEQNAQDTSAITLAQAQLGIDETILWQDQSKLASMLPTDPSLQTQQQTVNRDSLTVQKDEAAVTSAQKQQQQAQQQATQAKQTLDELQQQFNSRTSDKLALSNAKNQVDQAKLALQSAQETLKQDQQPPDAATLQQAQANVTTTQASVQNAQAQLQSAQQQLAETTLTAPINGVVAQINGAVGETASGSASNPFMVIVDTNKADLQVSLQLSETQIAEVKAGNVITLTAAAYPGKVYHGSVVQVYPVPTVTSNVTQYTAIATVDNSSGDLKVGMTASVSIQTAHADNVVIVPAIALQHVGSTEGVYVVDSKNGSTSGSDGSGNQQQWSGGQGGGSWSGGGGQGGGGQGGSGAGGGTRGSSGTSRTGGGGFRQGATLTVNGSSLPSNVHFQPVQVGLFGTNQVQIVSGLQAGEQILIELPAGSTSTSTGSSGFRLGGGGGGGFGGSGGGNRRSGSGGGGGQS